MIYSYLPVAICPAFCRRDVNMHLVLSLFTCTVRDMTEEADVFTAKFEVLHSIVYQLQPESK
jgi:hypothetical protein